MDVVRVVFVRERESEGLPLPAYATEGAAGLDLCAALPADEPLTLAPGQRALITTGLRIVLPVGCEGQVRARSGWAVQHGIGVLNAPGTIDSDYRGVVQILLVNWGQAAFTIERGDRIAQLVVAPVVRAVVVESETFSETLRGIGGFGSTGHKQNEFSRPVLED